MRITATRLEENVVIRIDDYELLLTPLDHVGNCRTAVDYLGGVFDGFENTVFSLYLSGVDMLDHRVLAGIESAYDAALPG